MSLPPVEQKQRRFEQLRTTRESWENTWKEITEQMIPYRVVWETTDRRKGDKKEGKIINSTPVEALKTLAAGMMAGITSPARKWFSLSTSDPELSEQKDVRVYLDQVQRIIETTLSKGGWYKALADGVYPDLGSIGTSAMFAEEGAPGAVRFKPLNIGEYWVDVNEDNDVDTVYRRITMTARQLVGKFGRDAVSVAAQRAWDEGAMDAEFVVYHAVQPNDEQKGGQIGPEGMPFASCWWMAGEKVFLRQGGYHEFPLLVPRWSSRAGDPYGRGPGWKIRGDCRALQHAEKNLAKQMDKSGDPPLKAKGLVKRASLLPGDLTHLGDKADADVEPIMKIDPAAMAVTAENVTRHEQRINQAMFVDLWRSILNDNRNQRATATEIEAQRQEVMLLLGPVLENLNNDLLEPAIERVFAILDRNDILPLPPEALVGTEVKIEFISILHQLQQTLGLVGIRTLVAETGAMAQLDPTVVDKLDGDVIIDELARITGVRPDAVLSDEEVAQVRLARAEREQAQQNGEAMLAASQGLKNVGSADPERISALANQFSPAAAAQGGALGPVSDQ